MPRREPAIEHIADRRDRSPRSELLLDIGDFDQPRESARFEIGAKIPVFERRIDLALRGLFRQERRRAVDHICRAPQIETGAARPCLQQQPAFVERPAGNRKLPPDEVAQAGDALRRIGNDRADRARIGIKHKVRAETALARNPQPIRDNDVGGATAQCNDRRVERRDIDDLQVEIGLSVEPLRADDADFPRKRAGLLHGDPQLVGGVRGGDEHAK
jgi:hypothetical protein